VSDEVERNIRKEFQYADILIHQDPHTESSTH
jgi:divalent metal cation (Fe/Co/Zn/Cd) transporter